LLSPYQTQTNQSSFANYGFQSNSYTNTSSGYNNNYSPKSGFNHFVKLPVLPSATKLFYRVGSNASWSNEFTIDTPYYGPFKPFSVAIYGDMGIVNAEATAKSLNLLASQGRFDFVAHCGDISYADDHASQFEETWNIWFQSMQPLLTSKFYQAAVGNHEFQDPLDTSVTNFTTFRHKFYVGNESGSNTNMWYSYNYQNIHFVAISTESDYPGAPEMQSSENVYDQLVWLQKDLQNANLPQNRKLRPWIFVYGHRPIYSSENQQNQIPIGVSLSMQKSFEEIFKTYNVDIFFSGHVHNYQRLYPIYQNQITSKGYNDPSSTMYIVSGAAGNIEGFEDFNPNPWVGYGESNAYGFGILDVLSNTELKWSFYSSSNLTVLDQIYISKQH